MEIEEYNRSHELKKSKKGRQNRKAGSNPYVKQNALTQE